MLVFVSVLMLVSNIKHVDGFYESFNKCLLKRVIYNTSNTFVFISKFLMFVEEILVDICVCISTNIFD